MPLELRLPIGVGHETLTVVDDDGGGGGDTTARILNADSQGTDERRSDAIEEEETDNEEECLWRAANKLLHSPKGKMPSLYSQRDEHGFGEEEAECSEQQDWKQKRRVRTRSGSSSIGSVIRCKRGRESALARDYMDSHISRMPYEQYLRSPFAFIDGIERGHIPQSEFVYLMAQSHPYDLQIVSADRAMDSLDYYTLSSAGVTHFIRGKGSFSTLSQWQREFYLFQSLRTRVAFFRSFALVKHLKAWKKLCPGLDHPSTSSPPRSLRRS